MQPGAHRVASLTLALALALTLALALALALALTLPLRQAHLATRKEVHGLVQML